MEIIRTSYNVKDTSKGNYKIVKTNYYSNRTTCTREFIYGFKTEEDAFNRIKKIKDEKINR